MAFRSQALGPQVVLIPSPALGPVNLRLTPYTGGSRGGI